MQGLRLHRDTVRQLVRFGIAGGLSSIVYSLVYLPLTAYVFPRELAVAAVPFAFIIAVTFGFFAHSRWSFKDYGNRTPGIGQHLRFVAVQSTGLVINAVVTWVGTAVLGLPPWAPLLPAVLLAAAITFILNRQWVFG
ncbi:GtrA family protein [Sphingomonas xinjiangensis]|nr:GtrA family protein [Sphingomonas xinjiangensis]